MYLYIVDARNTGDNNQVINHLLKHPSAESHIHGIPHIKISTNKGIVKCYAHCTTPGRFVIDNIDTNDMTVLVYEDIEELRKLSLLYNQLSDMHYSVYLMHVSIYGSSFKMGPVLYENIHITPGDNLLVSIAEKSLGISCTLTPYSITSSIEEKMNDVISDLKDTSSADKHTLKSKAFEILKLVME